MIRSEIVDYFRAECPEAPSRVVSDTVLHNWLLMADKEFCAATRCIVDADGTTITTAENDYFWDLSAEITKFYDVDNFPGSGVLYNNKKLDKATMGELDNDSPTWRDWGSGTPKKWYRRGKYLYLDRKIDSAAEDIKVYSVLISDDWNADVAPFNQLAHLEPFHQSMVLYLVAKAKIKVGKPEEAVSAQNEYMAFLRWAKTLIGGNKYGPIFFQKKV